VVSDVFVDGGNQLRDAGEHAAAQPLGGDVAKEAFDHVQPRGRSGGEVHDESRMLFQPRLHGRMLVRGVVVGDQMQRLVLGRFAVDLLEELQPLGMAVARLALRDDLAIEHIECGKQRGRTVALVIVGHRLRPSLLQRQTRLGTIKRLNLTLLVAAQHQRMFRGRHVQPHDVFELLHELRVARDLEAVHEVRLQPMGLPVPADGAGGHTQLRGHLARAPVCGRFRLALRGQFHQPLHIHLGRWRPARQVAFDARKARLNVALTPARNLNAPHAESFGNFLVLQALRGQQHNVRALRKPHAGSLGTHELAQLGFLLIAQHNNRGNSQWLAPSKPK